MAKRRRRHPRPIQPEADAQPDPMDLIREQADEPTPARMSDEEIEAEALAQEDVADEIAEGMAEIEDEDEAPSLMAPETQQEVVDSGEEYVAAAEPAPTDTNPFAGSPVASVHYDEVDWEPPFDPEIFERGPLAAGIRMLEALLTEARSGYITAQIDELARVLDIDPSPDERFFLARVAASERTASGLPDVAGAYQALVSAKARVQA